MNWKEKTQYLSHRVFSYKRTLWYLLRKKGLRAAANFLYSKSFVLAGGEGTGAWALLPFMPVLRRFPSLKPYLYSFPSQAEIEITLKCNKKCMLCEHTHWNEPPEELSFEDFKKIVDQLPTLKWVNLTGEGDAFLNKDYLKMIEYLKQRDVCVHLVDSFDLIDADKARRLIELGVDGIWVSMDAATKETYERMKEGCKFERTLQNLKTLVQMKKEMGSPLPELCFRYIVTNLNVQEIPSFIELIDSLGDKRDLGDGTVVEFVGLLKYKGVEQYYIESIPPDILSNAIRKAEELGVYITFSHADPDLQDIRHCAAWSEPYIMMKGYVISCCALLQSNSRDFLKKHSFGNMLEQPFSEIWNSERYKRFRGLVCSEEGTVPLVCKNCRAYDTRSRQQRFGVSAEI